MAKLRFATPIIQLPAVPRELDAFKQEVEVQFNLLASPAVIRVHEFNTINFARSGDGLPVGAFYGDENGFVRFVLEADVWAPRKQISVQVSRGGVE